MEENKKRTIDRRDFIKVAGVGVISIAVSGCIPASKKNGTSSESASNANGLPKVYMTTAITPAAMMTLYNALGRKVTGKVAVKVSTGEAGNTHYLAPDLIKDLVQSVNGTIVECNTAYDGQRTATENHKKVAADHGFTAIAPLDIMDETGSITLPYPQGKNITENFVGASFNNYDSFLVLSHFKGHAMGGFGGAIKNLSIGIASREGKCWIHTAGNSKTSPWGGEQDPFLESMAEAAGAVMDKVGDRTVYINVMNHLSVDCDCDGNPAPPEMDDIGILASLDPIALDKACVDLIYSSDTQRSASMRERIESRNGMLTLIHGEILGLGSQKYELITL